jgi:purine-binding chemotaxis protein CheW
MQTTKQAIFMLGEEEYGLDIMDVNIIEKVIPVEPVVNFPKNLKGIINLRGDIIPVYSLKRKFGLEEKEADENTRYIITTSNGILIAYEVDKMVEIVQFEQEQLNEVPPIVKSKDTSYMKYVTNVHDRLVIILDHDGILTEDEQSKIKTVVKK